MATKFTVIFDNGGGTTLQVGKRAFVHHYDDPAQAAQDVQVLLDGGNTSDWDGNNPEERIEYDLDDERNGGTIWHDQVRIKEIIKSGELRQDNSLNGHGWRNAENFYEALGVKIEE